MYRCRDLPVYLCFPSVQGTLFMQTLIDDYIIPLTKQASPDFTELAHAIGRVAVFYACGVLASFAQSKLWYTSHREHSGT